MNVRFETMLPAYVTDLARSSLHEARGRVDTYGAYRVYVIGSRAEMHDYIKAEDVPFMMAVGNLQRSFSVSNEPNAWSQVLTWLDEPDTWLIMVCFNARDGYRVDACSLVTKTADEVVTRIAYNAWSKEVRLAPA